MVLLITAILCWLTCVIIVEVSPPSELSWRFFLWTQQFVGALF